MKQDKTHQDHLPEKDRGSILLITGGSRSGKSTYAQTRAQALPGPRLFVATCPYIDDEMAERIEQHKRDRIGKGFETIEEPENLSAVLSSHPSYGAILVDCLTLWINNLLYRSEREGRLLAETEIVHRCNELTQICHQCRSTVIFVTNEVGLGLVPGDPISRRYRDLVGRCNQVIAAAAREVVLLTAGIPLVLKQER